MNELYPEITPYAHEMLDVGEQHLIYVEQCGNPNGIPILFVHGGPGGGCSQNDRRFFDPDAFRIVLFDQRGCGRSTPHGLLANNTTQDLVADIEKIRNALNIESWHVFGGSWGSTLALIYAQTHANAVLSLILRGIFLAREFDAHWTFGGGGASDIYPDHWQTFKNAFKGHEDKASISGAYELMTGEDKELALNIARAWSLWEMRISTLVPNPAHVKDVTMDDRCWTLARHEAHYMVNKCFLSENQILENCHKIAHIPTTIVHGRYDIVCTVQNAWELHKRLPLSTLHIADAAGHSSGEAQTKDKLIAATKQLIK